MTSMKKLFSSDYNKNQKNFIKENIRKIKNCQQHPPATSTGNRIIHPKLYSENNKIIKTSKLSNYYSNSNDSSVIKYNFRVFKCNGQSNRKNVSNNETKDDNIKDYHKTSVNQGSQTDFNFNENEKLMITCHSCGQSVQYKNVALQTSFSENNPDLNSGISNKICSIDETEKKLNSIQNCTKDSHQISHEHEDFLKKEVPLNYRKGVIPRYLIERNAKLEKELRMKEEKHKLAELQGLNDPKCPPGHMLMPAHDLSNKLEHMKKKYEALITELNKMPMSSDSYRIRQRKIQIEKELNELDAEIELFETGKVFIKIPEEYQSY